MRFVSLLLASGLWASTVCAFENTSPFFLFSTSHLQTPPSRPIASSHQLQEALSSSLSSCASDVYILVSQLGVSAEDFQPRDASARLRKRLTGGDATIRSKTIISEVSGGGLDAVVIKDLLSDKCSATYSKADIRTGVINSASRYPYTLQIDLPALPSSGKQRASKLADHDAFIDAAINSLDGRSYTLIYTTTPPRPVPNEQIKTGEHASWAEENLLFDWDVERTSLEAVHIDLKRNLAGPIKKRQDSTQPDVALFEKYNFLSPGIFMGGLAIVILLSIAMVGLSALSSLEVSYAAFSKEMGPSQQKN